VARIPLVNPPRDDRDPRPEGDGVLTGGFHPNVSRAIANHPEAYQAFSAFGGFVYGRSTLSPARRELAYLTATVVNCCHY
jgi:alkylhydroperoxidase family enzyme